MFNQLILALLLLFAASAQARPYWSLGTGLESRLQREVNPDYVEMRALGQLFAQMRIEKWGVHGELSDERRDSSAGGLSVSARSTNTGFWGRYHFGEKRWKPFAGLGLGSYFDRVSSDFAGQAHDDRSGMRAYWGVNAGLSAVYLRYLLLEAEGRMTLVQDRREPMISALLRVGVYL